MLFTDFSSLLTISINTVLVGYYRICPTVLLQATPNLLLLLNRGTIRVGCSGLLLKDEYLPIEVLGESPSLWTNNSNLIGLLRTAFESDWQKAED